MKTFEEIKFLKNGNFFIAAAESSFPDGALLLNKDEMIAAVLNQGKVSNWIINPLPLMVQGLKQGEKCIVIRIVTMSHIPTIGELVLQGSDLVEKIRDIDNFYPNRLKKEKKLIYNNSVTFDVQKDSQGNIQVIAKFRGEGQMDMTALKILLEQHDCGDGLWNLHYGMEEGIVGGIMISKQEVIEQSADWVLMSKISFRDDGDEEPSEGMDFAELKFADLDDAIRYLRESRGVAEGLAEHEKVLELDRLDVERQAELERSRVEEPSVLLDLESHRHDHQHVGVSADVTGPTEPTRKLSPEKVEDLFRIRHYSRTEVEDIIKLLRHDLDINSDLVQRILGD